MRPLVLLAALGLCACAGMPAPAGDVTGMPLGAFLDDLKVQLRQVHWHVRGNARGCGTTALRELDLHNGTVVVSFERVAQASIDGSVRLVAIPLGPVAVNVGAGGEYSRKSGQQLTVKLLVAGGTPVVDLASAPVARDPVAQALNAAIDGFVQSDTGEPCLQMTTLKLELVVDVTRGADGAFKVVVPALGIDAARSLRDVNTVTLSWDKVESIGLR